MPDETKNKHEQELWELTQAWARAAGFDRVAELICLHEGGTVNSVSPSRPQKYVAGDTQGEFPPAAGWGSRDIRVSFNGQVREVTGCRRKFIRCLIHFQGTIVTDRVLRLWVWGELDVTDGRLRDVAHQTRQFLRSLTGCDGGCDPIERVEGGYRLGVT